MSLPVVPDYGTSTLSDIFPSIGAHLGIPGADDVLQLPGGDRWVVMLVDGLGWQLLRRSISEVEHLADVLGDGRPITCGVPSTTATSITSLGTGLTPGQHGMAGYSFRRPGTSRVMNALLWDVPLDATRFQPKPTYLERLGDAGVRVTCVVPARFAGTGLTQAGLRGSHLVGFDDDDDADARAQLVSVAATASGRTLVYAYEGALDHTGHTLGCDSAAWLAQLRRIDRLLAALRHALPSDVRLLITGDHGMVDVPAAHRIVIEDHPALLADVSTFAGEGRLRQLYCPARHVRSVARRWQEWLGERAWVRTRAEAVDEGWLGAVDPDVADRFGSVLVALRGDWAVMTRTLPGELSLVGMHGSLTPAEMTVPLLIDEKEH